MVAVRQIKTYSFLIILFLFLNLYEIAEGATMSLFSKKEEKVVIFSPMQGVVTYKGKPAMGAKLERRLKWKDEIGIKDTVIADEKGRFEFLIVEDVIKLNAITQFVIAQEIFVTFKNREYPIWAKAKRGKALYDELNGKPIGLTCELTDQFERIESGNGMLITSCKWNEIKGRDYYEGSRAKGGS